LSSASEIVRPVTNWRPSNRIARSTPLRTSGSPLAQHRRERLLESAGAVSTSFP
jgi:hypothetical protein